MKNYVSFESGTFSISSDELKALPSPVPLRFTDTVKARGYLNDKYGSSENPITHFELRPLPERLKKNNSDSAKILIIYRQNGDLMAKRHNNSQWLRLE